MTNVPEEVCGGPQVIALPETPDTEDVGGSSPPAPTRKSLVNRPFVMSAGCLSDAWSAKSCKAGRLSTGSIPIAELAFML